MATNSVEPAIRWSKLYASSSSFESFASAAKDVDEGSGAKKSEDDDDAEDEDDDEV